MLYRSESYCFECICIFEYKIIGGEDSLLLNRSLVFSTHAPFSYILEIPKITNENRGVAEGGSKGGIPPRPPLSQISSSFLGDFAFSEKLREFLLKVRTWFAENPNS
jgi:hypothetical protein